MYEFRKYKIKQGNKKVRHPKLIVDEYEDEYGFLGLTSRKCKGKDHNNFPLIFNPKFGNDGKRLKTNSYLRRKVEYDKKTNFTGILMDYTLSEIDKMRVNEYIINKLKKR